MCIADRAVPISACAEATNLGGDLIYGDEGTPGWWPWLGWTASTATVSWRIASTVDASTARKCALLYMMWNAT